MKKEKEKDYSYHWFFLGLVVILILILSLLSKQKEKELEEIKNKLQENEKLLKALEQRTKRVFMFSRFIFIFTYFFFNFYFYKWDSLSIEKLLSYNSTIFILISGLTFVRFGSFSSYNRWWRFAEIKIEVFIYRKSPDLRKIIINDEKYKIELETEIKELNTLF